MEDYIYIGKVVGTHGIKGEIRIISDSEIKDQVFIPGKKIYFGRTYEEHIISSYRRHKNYEMITIDNISDINDVLYLRGQKAYVNRKDIIVTDYLLDDLLGMEVLEDNKVLGKVIDVIKNGSNILLQVSGEKNFYIPKVDEYIINVDVVAKKIIVKNTKGLML